MTKNQKKAARDVLIRTHMRLRVISTVVSG